MEKCCIPCAREARAQAPLSTGIQTVRIDIDGEYNRTEKKLTTQEKQLCPHCETSAQGRRRFI